VAVCTLEIDELAAQDLEGLSPKVAERVVERLVELEESATPRGDTIKTLQGFKIPTLRFRIGEYRAVFRVVDDRVVILRVIHRSGLDRTLKKLR
jgi:mRNA-degrading endonuclease RelE of RelBE toxin-antitoxin system